MHDNDVNFVKNGLQKIGFAMQSYSITPGQPWGGVSSIGAVSNGVGTLVVTAGRKASSTVADFFNTQSAGAAKLACGTVASSPSKLNFAVQGDLTLQDSTGTIVCSNFVMGQGNDGNNNWWITAPGMAVASDHGIGKTKMQCSHNGAALTVYFSGYSCVNTFSVVP